MDGILEFWQREDIKEKLVIIAEYESAAGLAG